MRRAYQRTGRETYKILKNDITREIKKAIKIYNNKNWDKKLENLEVKDNTLWQTAKSLTKKSDTSIPTLHGRNGLVFSSYDKANALAEHFESVHRLTEDFGDEETEVKVNNAYNELMNTPIYLNEILLTSPNEIARAVKKTKPRKAPGADGIQNIAKKTYQKKQ